MDEKSVISKQHNLKKLKASIPSMKLVVVYSISATFETIMDTKHILFA